MLRFDNVRHGAIMLQPRNYPDTAKIPIEATFERPAVDLTGLDVADQLKIELAGVNFITETDSPVDVFALPKVAATPTISEIPSLLGLNATGPQLSAGFEGVQRFFIDWQSRVNQQLDDAQSSFFDAGPNDSANPVVEAIKEVRAAEHELHRIRKARELMEIGLSDLRLYAFGDSHARLSSDEITGTVEQVIAGIDKDNCVLVGIRVKGYYSR